MRYWIITEPVSATSSEPVYFIYSDQAVIDEYWNYWTGRMKQVGKEHMLDRETCIMDWATVHWAQEATPELLTRVVSGQ